MQKAFQRHIGRWDTYQSLGTSKISQFTLGRAVHDKSQHVEVVERASKYVFSSYRVSPVTYSVCQCPWCHPSPP